MNLKRDDDRKWVGGAISIVDLLTPTPLSVDPVTSRLLIDVTLDNIPASILWTTDKRDADREPTGYGVNATDGVTPLPLLIDHNNNYLFVDISFI
jgi:hypothetical protein